MSQALGVLFCLPYYETCTYRWSPVIKHYTKQLENKCYLYVLYGDDARKDKVYTTLREHKEIIPCLMLGHGNDNVYTGQNDEVIFESCNYPSEVIQGRVFWFISCRVGLGLCPDMVSKGAIACVGETEDYYFYIDPNTDALSDAFVYPFVMSELKGFTKFLEGYTIEEAWRTCVDSMYKYADLYESKGFSDVAETLRFDADHRKLFGNGSYRLTAPPLINMEVVTKAIYDALPFVLIVGTLRALKQMLYE